MIQAIKAVLVIVAGLIAASETVAAPCASRSLAIVEVDVQEAPVVMHGEFRLTELRAMSAQLRRPPIHPVLGFYAGTVGYTLRSVDVRDVPSETTGQAYPHIIIQAGLIAVDRRIAIAGDLSASPCRLRAAVEHYHHHAMAASLALHRFAWDCRKIGGRNVLGR